MVLNSVPPANGPHPWSAAHVAMPATSNAAGAAPRCWNRHAAHPTIGRVRKMRLWWLRNTASVAAVRATNSATASARRGHDAGSCRRNSTMLRRKGATTRTPIASPVHHTAQAEAKLVRGMASDSTSVPAPIVALISMLNSAATTMAMASLSRSISFRKPIANNSSTATKGATVLPAAVAAAASSEDVIVTLTRNAPRATPGQILRPMRRNATTAMPVGGHSGVTFFSISAKRSPSRATRK